MAMLSKGNPCAVWIQQELTTTGEANEWKVTGTLRLMPPECLIRWDFVVTVQLLDNLQDLKVTGFRPAT